MHTKTATERQFIRHSTNIPAEISTDISPTPLINSCYNISHGGLSFSSRVPLPVNHLVHVTIQIASAAFEGQARVTWRNRTSKHYDIGVQFSSREAGIRAHIIERICLVEQYRQEMQERFGIDLSSKEAALEWATRHVADFTSF